MQIPSHLEHSFLEVRHEEEIATLCEAVVDGVVVDMAEESTSLCPVVTVLVDLSAERIDGTCCRRVEGAAGRVWRPACCTCNKVVGDEIEMLESTHRCSCGSVSIPLHSG